MGTCAGGCAGEDIAAAAPLAAKTVANKLIHAEMYPHAFAPNVSKLKGCAAKKPKSDALSVGGFVYEGAGDDTVHKPIVLFEKEGGGDSTI